MYTFKNQRFFNKLLQNLFIIRYDTFESRLRDSILYRFYISLTFYTKINAIVIFINVFKDIFVCFNVHVNFNVDINIVFNRK